MDNWGERAQALITFVVPAVGTTSYWLPLLLLDEQSNTVYGDLVLAGPAPHLDFFATYRSASDLLRPELTAPQMRETVDALLKASPDGAIFIGAQDGAQATLTKATLCHLLPDA